MRSRGYDDAVVEGVLRCGSGQPRHYPEFFVDVCVVAVIEELFHTPEGCLDCTVEAELEIPLYILGAPQFWSASRSKRGLGKAGGIPGDH